MEDPLRTLEQLSAKEHSLAPLLYRTLKMEGRLQQVTEEVGSSLRQAYLANVARNLMLNKALVEVLDAFETHGIQAIVLKGAVLSETIYPDIGTRPMADVDLLVRPEDLPQIEVILTDLGYELRWSYELSEAFCRRFRSELIAYSDRWHASIDIHWHLLNQTWFHRVCSIDLSALWADTRPMVIGKAQALQLAPEHNLLHLCVHLALQHDYQGILWYVDIDRVARSEDIRWDRFVADAHAFKIKTAVYYALVFTRQLLGTPIPDSALNVLRPSRLRLRLVYRFVNPTMVLDADRPMLPRRGRFVLRLFLIDDWRDALRFLVSASFPDRQWMMGRYRLKRRWMLLLCYPLHWARVLAQAVSAVRHMAIPVRGLSKQKKAKSEEGGQAGKEGKP